MYEVVTPQKRYLEKGSEGKDYEKPVSHHTDFGNALKRVMKEKLHNEQDSYESIQEYIEKWDQLRDELAQIVNYQELK